MSFVRQPDYRTAFATFERFLGCTLCEMAHDRYYFNGVADDSGIGTVVLAFDGALAISLLLIGDGQSVTATNGSTDPIPSFDLDAENRCNWRRTALTDGPPYSKLLGLTLDRVIAEVCRCEIDGDCFAFTAGWWLYFGTHKLGYFNLGDNAKLFLDCEPPSDPTCKADLELVATKSGG